MAIGKGREKKKEKNRKEKEKENKSDNTFTHLYPRATIQSDPQTNVTPINVAPVLSAAISVVASCTPTCAAVKAVSCGDPLVVQYIPGNFEVLVCANELGYGILQRKCQQSKHNDGAGK